MKQIKLAILSCVLLVSMLIGNVSVVSADTGDVFTAEIELVSPAGTTSKVECAFKVLKEPTATEDGEVQVGGGLEDDPAIAKATKGAITIPNVVTDNNKKYTVTTIGRDAFYMCAELTSTGLESNKTITSIADYAFAFCDGLTSTGLESNETVTTIPNSAFYGCASLISTGLESNKTVKIIGESIFAGCTALASTGLESNETVTTLGDGTFAACVGLTSTGLEKNKTVKGIGMGAFAYCQGLTSTGLESNETLTTLGDGTFMFCQKLTSTGLESNNMVTVVGESLDPDLGGVFTGCTGLTSTGLESNKTVTTIGEQAFSGCKDLEKVMISENSAIISIGKRAFDNCTKLGLVIFSNDAIPTLGDMAFSATTTIYYPEGAANAERLNGYQNKKKFNFHNIEVDESTLAKEYHIGENFTLEGIKFKTQYAVGSIIDSKLDETIRYEDKASRFIFENVILKEGENTIKYAYLGKEYSFKVNTLPSTSAPNTGDTNNRTLLMSLLLISGLGIVVLGLRKKGLVK